MAAWEGVTPLLEDYKTKGMMRAMRTGVFDTIQIPYNLGQREAEQEILPLVKELNMGVLVMTPICPLFSRTRLLRALERQDLSFLRPYGVTTPGQALLEYLLAKPEVSTLIPATSKLERVKEDTEIAEGPVLSQDALIKLEAMLR